MTGTTISVKGFPPSAACQVGNSNGVLHNLPTASATGTAARVQLSNLFREFSPHSDTASASFHGYGPSLARCSYVPTPQQDVLLDPKLQSLRHASSYFSGSFLVAFSRDSGRMLCAPPLQDSRAESAACFRHSCTRNLGPCSWEFL